MQSGFTNIVIIDNFSNSTPLALPRIKTILSQAGIEDYTLITYNINLAEEKDKLSRICRKHQFFACLHFAGLKAIGESVANPLKYYRNNLNSTLNLLNTLQSNNCYNFIFSSSASVYGTSASKHSPVTEESEVCHGIINAYGWTKAFAEQILIHNAQSNPLVNSVILRYFNPIGAHSSGLIGEDPSGIPNNLMPYLLQVAVGRRKELHIFGSDYNTVDGTGVRDYIHVVDLAYGHVLALEKDIIPKWLSKQSEYLNDDSGDNLMSHKNVYYNNDDTSYNYDNNVSIYNLGTGKGTSVLEMLHALEKACGHKIAYKLENRRPGDVDSVFADCKLAQEKLGFKAKYDIERACVDSWRWQSMNPMGFKKVGAGAGGDEKNNDNDDDPMDGYDGNDVLTDVEDYQEQNEIQGKKILAKTRQKQKNQENSEKRQRKRSFQHICGLFVAFLLGIISIFCVIIVGYQLKLIPNSSLNEYGDSIGVILNDVFKKITTQSDT